MVVRAFVVEMVVMVVTMGENSRQAFAMHLVLGSTSHFQFQNISSR